MGTKYPLLDQVQDSTLRQVFKFLFDKIGTVESQAAGIGGVTKALTTHLDAGKNQLKGVADPTAKTDAVTLQYLRKYVQGALALDKQVVAPVVVPGTPTSTPAPTPGPGSGTTCFTSLAAGQPGGVPAAPNLRWFRGDLCGVEVPGLPAVTGGAVNASTVLSWFLDRYSPANQALIIATYKARGYTHFLLSWPDSRSGNGQSIAQFVATCQMVQANGLYPVVFLASKDYDGVDPNPASLDAIMAALLAGACVPIACVGWELDLFNTPGAPIQALINHVAATLVPTANLYVHFSQWISSWQANGQLGSVFWAANVGKLTGILYQRHLVQEASCGDHQARLDDFQVRFGNGAAGWPQDSGFGHPFDTVAFESSASPRFDGGLTEAQARARGDQSICTPAVAITSGPYAGTNYVIQGYGNGASLA